MRPSNFYMSPTTACQWWDLHSVCVHLLMPHAAFEMVAAAAAGEQQ